MSFVFPDSFNWRNLTLMKPLIKLSAVKKKKKERSAAAAAHSSILAEASNSINLPPLQDRLVTVLISQPSGCGGGGRSSGGIPAGE